MEISYINNEKDVSKHKAQNITREEMLERLTFWKELFPYFGEFKFSPYGSSTLQIPEFHTENIRKISYIAKSEEYQYSAMTGKRDLCQSIIDNFPEIKHFKEAGYELNPSNILITAGAVGGINSSIDALCEADDEVLLFEPIYPFHMGKILLRKDIKLRTVRMRYNSKINQFEFDYEALKNVLNSKTRLMIITNPHNPTTRVFTKEEYKRISEIIQDYPNLIVLEDAAYFLYYGDEHKLVPFATVNTNNFERTITFYSAGKMYNITGTRLGIAVLSKSLRSKIAAIFPMELHLSASLEQMIIRDDLVSANEKDKDSRDFYEVTRLDIVDRALRVERKLKEYGIKVIDYEGTYYLIFDVESYRGKIEEKYYYLLDEPKKRSNELDKAFCRMLFIDKKVGIFPLFCLYFGEDIPDNFVRVSINRNDADLEIFFDSLEILKKLF